MAVTDVVQQTMSLTSWVLLQMWERDQSLLWSRRQAVIRWSTGAPFHTAMKRRATTSSLHGQ
jgi:hypothetical protein